jgi:hypothetical protein
MMHSSSSIDLTPMISGSRIKMPLRDFHQTYIFKIYITNLPKKSSMIPSHLTGEDEDAEKHEDHL